MTLAIVILLAVGVILSGAMIGKPVGYISCAFGALAVLVALFGKLI